jgi:hypothetical protein
MPQNIRKQPFLEYSYKSFSNPKINVEEHFSKSLSKPLWPTDKPKFNFGRQHVVSRPINAGTVIAICCVVSNIQRNCIVISVVKMYCKRALWVGFAMSF